MITTPSMRNATAMLIGMATPLGTYIRDRRHALGFSTQASFAEHAGINRAHLSQIEGGKIALPNPDLRRRIASALGVSHLDVLVAAGELGRDEVRRAGVDGVVEPDPLSPKAHLHAVVDTYDWTEQDAVQVADYMRFVKRQEGHQ